MKQAWRGLKQLSGIVVVNAFAAAAPCTADAAGFRLPDMSIAGLGSANAMVANSEEIGALPYNPAGMSFHRGLNVTGGFLGYWTYMDVTNAAGTSSIDVSRPGTPAPALYVSGEINPDWHVGLAVNASFGQQTNWRARTFPGFAASGFGALEPSRSKITMLNFNPNVSYLVTRPSMSRNSSDLELSVAGGLDYYRVFKAQLDTQAIGLSGDGDGVGWNLAALGRYGRWGFGVSHRSAVGVDIKAMSRQVRFQGLRIPTCAFPR